MINNYSIYILFAIIVGLTLINTIILLAAIRHLKKYIFHMVVTIVPSKKVSDFKKSSQLDL
ncbi:MAG: hypothetical protein ACFFDN_00820 [Candidatus Hodarchaeota archaeon]